MTLALYGKSRKRQGGLLLAALLAVIGATVGGLLIIGTAFAHENVISGQATCQGDGTYTIVWTISNDYDRTVTINKVLLNNAGSDLKAGLSVNPIDRFTHNPHSATLTTTGIPGNATSATLDVWGRWSDGYPATGDSGYTPDGRHDSGTKTLSGKCQQTTGKIQVHKYIWNADKDKWEPNTSQGQPGPDFHFGITEDNTKDWEDIDQGANGAGITLNTGTYHVFEKAKQGYDFVAFYNPPNNGTECKNGAPSGPNDTTNNSISVTVPKDATTHVCAYNKVAQTTGKVTIDKFVDTGDGWAKQSKDAKWQFTLNSSNDANDVSMNNETKTVNIDDYVLTETPPTGYVYEGAYISQSKCGLASYGPDFGGAVTSLSVSKSKVEDDVYICAFNSAKPDLKATKTDNVSGAVTSPAGFSWSIKVENIGTTRARFEKNDVVFVDNLPSGPSYTLVGATGTTTKLNCTLASNTITCKATDDYFTLNAGDSFTVGVSVSSTAGLSGAYTNPKADGKCKVDPDGKVIESNEDNNTCTNTVTVNQPVVIAPSISKVAHNPAISGTTASWDIIINNPVGGATQPVVTITDSKTDIAINQGASTLNGATCAVVSGVITCNNVAVGTTTIVVTRSISGSTLATGSLCAGGTIENSISSATAGQTQLTITAGGTAVSETVPANQDACGQPTIVKTLVDGGTNATSVSDAANVRWKITVTNPADGSDPRFVQVKDSGVSIVSGPTFSGPSGSSCTNLLTDASGASCSVKAGGSVTWVVAPATTPTRTCSAQDFTNTAQFNLSQFSVSWQDAAGPKITLTGDTASCSKQVIFGKYVCNAYSDVEANEDPTNATYNDIGTHVADLKSPALGSNVAVTPLNDGRTAANCHLEPWDFVLKDGNNLATVTQNIHVGASLDPITINAASMALALQPTRLRVEEVTKAGYGFAGIKCYTDHLHSDNWEWIDFSGGIPEGDVYCLAYNIKPPRTIEVCKIIDQNNDGIADDATFTFGVRGHGSEAFETVQLDANEGGEQVCKTVTVPDNSQSSDIEVFEWGSRPSGWTDAQDFPKISVNGGALSSNGTADLGSSGNGTVTFHNKKQGASQDVTLIKVICPTFGDVPANLPIDGGNYGTNDMPSPHTVADLGPAGPAGANDAVSLANIPSSCVRVPGWSFDIKDSGGQFYRTVTTTGSIGSAGVTITLTADELQSALKPWHDESGYHGLYVSEQKQTGYGFAAMKCYKDHKLLDNVDGINLPAAGTEGVYCIAYNVADPVHVTVAKSNNLGANSQVNAGGSFTWTITVTVSGSQTAQPVTVSDPMPTGFTASLPPAAGDFNCSASTATNISCTLPAGASVGDHTISFTATAPAPAANVCGPYTNVVTIANADGNGGETAPQIPRQQLIDNKTASNGVEVVNCTGTVVIKKIVTSGSSVNPNDQNPAFTGLFDGSSWGNLQNGQSKTFTDVPAGSGHAITETQGSVNAPGDTLWQPGIFIAGNADGVCPAGPAGETQLTPGNISVTANQTTTICVFNQRNQPNTVTANVFVYKVIASAFGSTTDTFTGTVSSPDGGGNFSITTLTGATFPISLTTDHANSTFSVSEAAKAGYTTLGYKVVEGNAACPAPDGNYLSSVTNHAIGQASSPAYTVCIYNDPRVSISVHKTEQNGATSSNGQGWNVTVSGCGIVPQTKATDALGNATFSDLPLCNSYVVSEDVNSKGVGAYSPANGFPSSVVVNATTPGSTSTVLFANVQFINPCPFGCTPIIVNTPTTPTTPTATPVTPTATQPTAKPTEPTKTEGPSTVETPTASPTVQITLGEKTPGANATPLAPQTGSGLFGTGKSGSNLLLAVLGIFSLSAGFAVIAVANKNKSRS